MGILTGEFAESDTIHLTYALTTLIYTELFRKKLNTLFLFEDEAVGIILQKEIKEGEILRKWQIQGGTLTLLEGYLCGQGEGSQQGYEEVDIWC